QADIVAHPHAYKIPCLWEKPMEPSLVFGEGETFKWHGTILQANKTRGRTEHHCARRFEVDGRRIAYVGDTLARSLGGPRFGGPVYPNRLRGRGLVASAAKIRGFE